MDGPVVRAAQRALRTGDPEIVLPYVPAEGEREVGEAFRAAMRARAGGGAAREVADRWFYETVVRVHRAGEGAPFTGLRPAGEDHGTILPIAERALATESPDELADALCGAVREQVERRLRHATHLRSLTNGDIRANRAAISAMLDLEVWAHTLFMTATAAGHPHEHA